MSFAPLFWSVFILLFMYSSQLGDTSGKASFESQLSSPDGASRGSLSRWRGSPVEVGMICGHVPFKALKSDSWTPPKMELCGFWSWFTWKPFVPFRGLREPTSLNLLSFVFICCSMSTFYTHAREPLCVSKKGGCSRFLGCGRAPCELWTEQDFRFLVFNKFRIKATSKWCLIFKGLSFYYQQPKQ